MPPLAWSAASVLGDGPVPIDARAQLAVNTAGDAVAVWTQRIDNRPAVVGSSYRAGTWSAPQVIRASIGDATEPRVGIDDDGHAVVAWRDSDTDGQLGQTHAMWSARGTRQADGSIRWTAGFKLPASAEALDNFALRMSPAGTAVLAWREFRPAVLDLPAQRNLVVAEGDGTTWSVPLAVETADGDVDHPALAVGAGGAAVLAWEQASDSGAAQVLVSRRAAASSWSPPRLLSVTGGSNAILSTSPRVAVAGDGRALVVWQQNQGPLRSLWSSTGTAGGSWSAGLGITASDEARQFNEPVLAMNAAGRALLAWGDARSSWNQIFVRGYDAGSGTWGDEQQASTDELLQNTEQQIAIDAQGRATLVWRGSSANPHVFARTLDSAARWVGATRRIDGPAEQSSYDPQIAVDGSGRLLSVWSQFSGSVGKVWKAAAQ